MLVMCDVDFNANLFNISGLSSTLNTRIVYLDIMKPFAESTLREWVWFACIWPWLSCGRAYLLWVFPNFNLFEFLHNFMDTRSMGSGPEMSKQWIFNTPVHSDVEVKLRQHLIELGDKILGIQVSIHKCLEYSLWVAWCPLGVPVSNWGSNLAYVGLKLWHATLANSASHQDTYDWIIVITRQVLW